MIPELKRKKDLSTGTLSQLAGESAGIDCYEAIYTRNEGSWYLGYSEMRNCLLRKEGKYENIIKQRSVNP